MDSGGNITLQVCPDSPRLRDLLEIVAFLKYVLTVSQPLEKNLSSVWTVQTAQLPKICRPRVKNVEKKAFASEFRFCFSMNYKSMYLETVCPEEQKGFPSIGRPLFASALALPDSRFSLLSPFVSYLLFKKVCFLNAKSVSLVRLFLIAVLRVFG